MEAQAPLKIAILSALDNPALAAIPRSSSVVDFVVVSDREGCLQLGEQNIRPAALVIIPPFRQSLVDEVWDTAFGDVRWVHTFSAGVDFIADLTERRLLDRPDVLLTNGRGAFSSSLAEYIIASAMHFNKQICRLQKNRSEAKWEKFVMHTLKGKKMGFIGYGDIAKSAATIAKNAFGMDISVYRRNIAKFETEAGASIVDEICDTSEAVFSTSDFVVCTLPGTPATANFCSSQFALMKPNAVFISCGR
jgi:phosphoglycerate dehydrogenase-like enzyme